MPAAGKAYCHLEGDFGTSRFLAAVRPNVYHQHVIEKRWAYQNLACLPASPGRSPTTKPGRQQDKSCPKIDARKVKAGRLML